MVLVHRHFLKRETLGNATESVYKLDSKKFNHFFVTCTQIFNKQNK